MKVVSEDPHPKLHRQFGSWPVQVTVLIRNMAVMGRPQQQVPPELRRNDSRRVGIFSKPSSSPQPPTLVLMIPGGSRHQHQIAGLELQTPSSTVAEVGDDAQFQASAPAITLRRADPSEELAAENRSLHQRIAAMQRTELDLLSDNQRLSRKLAAAQKHYELRRDQWKEQWLSRERIYEERIRQLEARIAERERELKDALDRSPGAIIRMHFVDGARA